jgi:radical SAM superfamily enzyme YgiQ (UPF0313 family)
MNTHKWEPASPPLALDYIAWELEKLGIQSDIIDITFLEEVHEELATLLCQTRYQGVCMTIRNLDATTSPQHLNFPLHDIRDLVQVVKSYLKCPVIVGGNGFSIAPERILEYLGADYGIWGPGEEFLPLLLQYIFEGKGTLAEIPHAVYKKEGTVCRNPGRDSSPPLPPIRRGYVQYSRYYRPRLENHGRFGNIETKRGCPYSCSYCVEPFIKGKMVRLKSPEAVSREMDWFLRRGIRYFFLTDSEFNADEEAALSLCEYWIRNGYNTKMKWVAYAIPNHFSESLASSISAAGNLSIMIDFAHVSDSMLYRLGKSYRSQSIEDTVARCEAHDLNYRGSLMLGGPGETRETVKEAINFFKGRSCKMFVVVGIRVFPHTPLAAKIREKGSLVDNPNLYGKVIDNEDLLEPVFYVSEDLGEDIFTYITELIGDSEQFYTPFQLKSLDKQMYGNFRGFKPQYSLSGETKTRYITTRLHHEITSRVFEEE